jgi:hypothetical protein
MSSSSDGSVYLPFSTNVDFQLMVIHSDGSYSTQQLDSTPAAARSRAIPDGQGGVLLIASTSAGAFLYHASTSGTSKFNLPFTPIAPRHDAISTPDTMLLGEDGTAYMVTSSSYLTVGDGLAAVDTNTGAVKWTAASPGAYSNLSAVTSDGSLAFQYRLLADFSQHQALVNSTGQVSPLFANPDGSDAGPVITQLASPLLPSYWTLGTWHAFQNNGLAAVTGENIFLAASENAVAGGSEKKDNKPHIPQIISYLPSQIESVPSPPDKLTTLNFPCYMDSHIWNSARNYKNNPCTNLFQQAASAKNTATQTFRLRDQALVRTFRADLGRKLDALAFIGHAEEGPPPAFPENIFTVGILFYYPIYPNLTPGDGSSWDWSYDVPWLTLPQGLFEECVAPNNLCDTNQAQTPVLNKLLPLEKDSTTVTGLGPAWNYHNNPAAIGTLAPGGPSPQSQLPHAPLLLVNKLSQQARVLFIGACAVVPKMTQPGEVPLFLQMWDIADVRFGTGVPELEDRAMIVPDGNSIPGEVFDTNNTDLAYAAAMWQQILSDMVVQKMTVKDAVDDANSKITLTWPKTNGVQQPYFMVLGNPKVVLTE